MEVGRCGGRETEKSGIKKIAKCVKGKGSFPEN